MPEPITNKTCKRCSEEHPISMFCRDKSRADGFHPWCKCCRREIARIAIRANPEKQRARVAKWRSENPERTKEISRESHFRNSEKRNAASRVYRAENLEKMRALGREWAKNNPDSANAITSARRASKKLAIPKWAGSELDSLIVSECYSLATLRTKLTGIKWHVDHTVPLRSNKVCGLHWSANMQVIPAAENCRKGNRVWPDMP